MGFGVYIHIPYCLQRCVYCDFATYEFNQILPPLQYVELVKKEISLKAESVGPRTCDTVYFGGGTPSLLEPNLLKSLIDHLKLSGFVLKSDCEVTLEINPATVVSGTVDRLLDAGFNRFSIGAQTFNDDLLKLAKRKHSAQDTRNTLELFKRYRLNFSADLLFALPSQTEDMLKTDLEELLSFEPSHISPYCLTVPDKNPMSKNRPLEDVQVQMFEIIRHRLEQAGFLQYEISNYALPGRESRHNYLYWNDSEYLGFGLSAHSYLKTPPWGARFWNPNGIQEYQKLIETKENWSISDIKPNQGEHLSKNESMTDFIHTALRLSSGLDLNKFENKFQCRFETLKQQELKANHDSGLVVPTPQNIRLTKAGQVLSNEVFRNLSIF